MDFGLAVFAAVLDLHAARERGVDRAVAVAGPVDRLVDELLVRVAVPRAVERDLDALESLGPLLVAIALDLDLHGTQRLLELLQEKHRVEAGAAPESGEQHLSRPHGGVVAEDRRLVDLNRVTRRRLEIEEHLVAGPSSGRLRHAGNLILGVDS